MKKQLAGIKINTRSACLLVVCLLLALEIMYLIAANLFLNTSVSSKMINRSPENRLIIWERGYSLYPGQVTLYDFDMRVKHKKNQWYVTSERISGHIKLFKLLGRSFHITQVDAELLSFGYQRHPTFFPESKRKKKKWQIQIDHAAIHSITELVIQGNSLKGDLTANGSMSFITRGEMIVNPTQLHLKNGVLTRSDELLAKDIEMTMTYWTDRFTPSVEKGKKALKYMSARMDATGLLGAYDPTETKLKKWSWLEINHSGHVEGHIAVDKGIVAKGSRVGITKTQIGATYQDLKVSGLGSMNFILSKQAEDPESIETADLEIGFDHFKITKLKQKKPLASGDGCRILIESAPIDFSQPFSTLDISVSLPPSTVSDATAFNSYLGGKDFLAFTGGHATLSGNIQYLGKAREGGGWLTFESDNLEMLLKGKPIATAFKLQANFSEFRPGDPRIVVTGSSINVKSLNRNWYSHSVLMSGLLSWTPEAIKKGGKVLKNAEGQFHLKSEVSDIDFINSFFDRQQGFMINGPGSLEGKIRLANADLVPGTSIQIDVPDIQASMLGYVARGNAILKAGIQAKRRPSKGSKANIDLIISDYTVRRQGEQRDHSKGEKITASIRVPDFELMESPDFEMIVNLPRNEIPDMSSYNGLLDKHSAFKIVSGKGYSYGRLRFLSQTESMEGELTLKASDLCATFETLPIHGSLMFEGKLNSDDEKNMLFNLDGSKLTLDQVWTGQNKPEENWSMICEFEKAKLTWKRPMLIKGEMSLKMTDTAPVVAIFTEKKRMYKILQNILTIKHIHGNAHFDLNENFFDVSLFDVQGKKLKVLGKARMSKQVKRGALYVKLKGIQAMISLEGDKKRPYFIRPLKKFHQMDVFIE
ncbi:MAG: hypothetical protein CR997_10735 [Acidobacteria bacterium]|nr:MAG: hypothetical protein CR997_10735 [Acidobacteriota bacterium]